jgi:uncharacterized damage-inducible protein DinB
VDRRIWFDRRFELGLPPEAFPDLLERVRGTPARLEERVRGLGTEVLTARPGDRWSIQENVGHLLDLEDLWSGRLDDYDLGSSALRPADLDNRKTFQAYHNRREIADLLAEFRRARVAMVHRLEALTDAQVRRTALHPRLELPMSVVDLLFFLAEHDDHHLARISEVMSLLAEPAGGDEG